MLSAEMADNSLGVKHLGKGTAFWHWTAKNNWLFFRFSQEQMGGTWDSTLIIPKKLFSVLIKLNRSCPLWKWMKSAVMKESFHGGVNLEALLHLAPPWRPLLSTRPAVHTWPGKVATARCPDPGMGTATPLALGLPGFQLSLRPWEAGFVGIWACLDFWHTPHIPCKPQYCYLLSSCQIMCCKFA